MKSQIATTALFVLIASPAQGQEERPTMTLDEAVQVARQRNPAFRRAEIGIRSAEANVLAAYGSFLPSLDARVGWNGSRTTTSFGTDDFGGTIVEDRSRTITNSNANQSLSTSLTLFDGFANLNTLRAARMGVEAQHDAVSIEELSLVANVSTAFYRAVVQQRQIDVEAQLLEARRNDLQREERLFTIGSSDQVKLLTVQLQVAQQEQSLEEAMNEARRRRLVVLQQMGILGEVTDFEPSGALPEIFDPTLIDPAGLVRVAIAQHPSIGQSEAQAAQRERELARARGERLPSITANGSFGRSTGSDGYGSFFDFNPSAQRGFNFGLQVSLPIFNRFSMSQSAANASVALDQAQEDAWERRLEREQSVRSALINLESAYTTLQLQTRRLDLNRQRLELAEEQYRFDAVTFIELQQYINDVATAERDIVNRQLDFATALVSLEQQVGQAIPRPEAP